MADIDWAGFSIDVALALADQAMSFSAVVARHPVVSKATLSRARAGRKLSAGNYLVLCRVLGLDPERRIVGRVVRAEASQPRLSIKDVFNQRVSQPVSREAERR